MDRSYIKNIILSSIFGFLCLLAVAYSSVEKTWDGMMYVASTSLTMAWNASERATWYEVQAVDIDHVLAPVYDLGTTDQLSMAISQQRTGHYMYRVRACNDAGCSDWAESTDPTYATVYGQSKAWRVYWKVPAPSGGGVN